jgi:hypothetical protein
VNRSNFYNQIREIIDSNGSKFTYIEFVKKDGSLRQMRVQPAATKFRVKGEAASPSHRQGAITRAQNHPNLINIYDVDQNAIRSINMDTLLTVRCGVTQYQRPAHEVEEMFR